MKLKSRLLLGSIFALSLLSTSAFANTGSENELNASTSSASVSYEKVQIIYSTWIIETEASNFNSTVLNFLPQGTYTINYLDGAGNVVETEEYTKA